MLCGYDATMKYRIYINEGFDLKRVHTGDLHISTLNFHLTQQTIYNRIYQIESDFKAKMGKNLTT